MRDVNDWMGLLHRSRLGELLRVVFRGGGCKIYVIYLLITQFSFSEIGPRSVDHHNHCINNNRNLNI